MLSFSIDLDSQGVIYGLWFLKARNGEVCRVVGSGSASGPAVGTLGDNIYVQVMRTRGFSYSSTTSHAGTD